MKKLLTIVILPFMTMLFCACYISNQRKSTNRENFFDIFFRRPFDDKIEENIIFSRDNEFLLCTFDSLRGIQSNEEIHKYAQYDSAIIVTLNITALKHFFPIIDTVFFNSESLIREYIGTGNNGYNCFDIYNSAMESQNSYPRAMVLYLLIKRNEQAEIQSIISKHDTVLISYNMTPYSRFVQQLFTHVRTNGYVDRMKMDTLYETDFYPPERYDIKKLYTAEDILNVYDFIDCAVQKQLQKKEEFDY